MVIILIKKHFLFKMSKICTATTIKKRQKRGQGVITCAPIL